MSNIINIINPSINFNKLMKSIIKHSLIPHSSSFLHSFHSSTFHSSNFINNQNNNNQLDHNQKNNITDFDAETLELIRARLKQTFKENSKYHLKYNLKYKEIANDAAVLMPLCIANGKPSVLFTIRSQNLKTHKGEVSFPGGKKDPTDQSPEITALRETFEEIRISPKDIDILGQDTILPNKDYTLKVHPFVGFIKFPIRIGKDKDDQEINYNKHEVSGVFTVTLNELLNPKIRTYRQFRNTKIEYPVYQAPSWAKLEIWGLTAFILNNILKKLTDPPLKKK